ncbi:heme oxygenase-like protein, partial [Ramaria rubella]
QSLTSHLLTVSADAYQRATQHSFLKAAGDKSISDERLERWLTQDKIYAFIGYPKFISLLISRVPLRASPSNGDNGSQSASLEERILALLSFSLSNIVHEVDFFKNTAQENGLDIARSPRRELSVANDLTGSITKAYTDFMISTAATGGLGDGLVLLWATEKCYLEAWTYARSQRATINPSLSAGTHRALEAFIGNWTSEEFRGFVEQIGSLLDEYAGKASANEYEELKDRAEQIWRWCLWYEERFW